MTRTPNHPNQRKGTDVPAPDNTVTDQVKNALSAFFPPELIRWRTVYRENPKPGENVRVVPVLTPDVVRDRLDDAAGMENWQEEYSVLETNEIECRLALRFDREWVTKVGVGSTDKRKENLAPVYGDALVSAAAGWGVGRYFSAMPQLFRSWDGKAFGPVPTIPRLWLPEGYRDCGPVKGERLANLVRTAADKNGKDVVAVSLRLYTDYGYPAPEPAPANLAWVFAKMQNRHADELLQRVGGWITDTAQGLVNSPYSPFYQPGTNPAVPAPAAPPLLPPSPKEPESVKSPAESENLPKNGAELLTRLYAYQEQLVGRKLCVNGAVLAHVLTEGAKNKHPADITQWNATAIARGVQWATDFGLVLKKQAARSAAPAGGG